MNETPKNEKTSAAVEAVRATQARCEEIRTMSDAQFTALRRSVENNH